MFSPLRTVLLGMMAGVWLSSIADAGPVGPVYTTTQNDCGTRSTSLEPGEDPGPRWTIGGECRRNPRDTRRRPATFAGPPGDTSSERVAAAEYYRHLDLVVAQGIAGEQHVDRIIDLFGVHVAEDGTLDPKGLSHRYVTLVGTDADRADGYWLALADDTAAPTVLAGGAPDPGRAITGAGAAGRHEIATGNPLLATLDGHDRGGVRTRAAPMTMPALFARLMPAHPAVVEFVMDYKTLGFTPEAAASLIDRTAAHSELGSGDGSRAAGDRPWTGEDGIDEAGASHPDTSSVTKPTFGPEGLGNVYFLLDTLRHIAPPPPPSPVPEPGGLLLIGSGVGLAWAVRRRRAR